MKMEIVNRPNELTHYKRFENLYNDELKKIINKDCFNNLINTIIECHISFWLDRNYEVSKEYLNPVFRESQYSVIKITNEENFIEDYKNYVNSIINNDNKIIEETGKLEIVVENCIYPKFIINFLEFMK